MDYRKLGEEVLENIGGKKNIIKLTHCITRLRFELIDENIAKTETIKNLDGVINVVQNGEEYQVVIGPKVDKVYEEILKIADLKDEITDDEMTERQEKKDKNPVSAFLTLIMHIFSPLMSVLAASGAIKGIVALLALLKVLDKASGSYIVLNGVGDALFYFLPIILGYTAAKKMGVKDITGMTLGGILMYPAIQDLMKADVLYTVFSGSIFKSEIRGTFLGIPLIIQRYAGTVVPIILAVYVASKIQKMAEKIIPSVVKSFLVPLLTLLITGPLAILVIGPAAYILQKLLGTAVNGLIGLNPAVAGFFVGSLWSIFVMFGLHWGIIPLFITNISTYGYDVINPLIYPGSSATLGAVLAVILKTKSAKIKNIAIPAFISTFCGVNEPSLYGVLIPRKKIFVTTLVSAGIGSVICGLSGSKLYQFGMSGPLGFPNFINPAGIDKGFIGLITGALLSAALSFVAAFILINSTEESEIEKKIK